MIVLLASVAHTRAENLAAKNTRKGETCNDNLINTPAAELVARARPLQLCPRTDFDKSTLWKRHPDLNLQWLRPSLIVHQAWPRIQQLPFSIPHAFHAPLAVSPRPTLFNALPSGRAVDEDIKKIPNLGESEALALGKASAKQRQEHKCFDVKLRHAPNLQAVLDLLGDLRSNGTEQLRPTLIPIALNALALRAAAEGGACEALQIGEWLVEAAVTLNDCKLLESAVTCMVRLYCGSGVHRRALSLLTKAEAAGVKLQLRTLSPILSHASVVHDLETCDRIWSQLLAAGLVPMDAEYASMLRAFRDSPHWQRKILLHMLANLPLPSDPYLIEEIGRVFGVAGVAALHDANPTYAAGWEVNGLKWKVGWTSVDPYGLCAFSAKHLQTLEISQTEEEDLYAYISRLASGSGGNGNFYRFQQWLHEHQPYDIIIDGANIGFNNQNFEGGQFQYHQIDATVRHFMQLEPGRRILLVLKSKWLKENANLTIYKKKCIKSGQIPLDPVESSPTSCSSVELDERHDARLVYPHDGITNAERIAAHGSSLQIIRSWKERGVLLRVPDQDCDDWYWLFAAIDSARRGSRNVQIVSNDRMRDHHWRMHSLRTFLRWQAQHMTRVTIRPKAPNSHDYSVTLDPPPFFSPHAQVSADGNAWHFPVPKVPMRAAGRRVSEKEKESLQHSWLVAWRE